MCGFRRQLQIEFLLCVTLKKFWPMHGRLQSSCQYPVDIFLVFIILLPWSYLYKTEGRPEWQLSSFSTFIYCDSQILHNWPWMPNDVVLLVVNKCERFFKPILISEFLFVRITCPYHQRRLCPNFFTIGGPMADIFILHVIMADHATSPTQTLHLHYRQNMVTS